MTGKTKMAPKTHNLFLMLGIVCILCGVGMAACGVETGPCDEAHETDNHSCEPDNCLNGYYWTTAVPGKCENDEGQPDCYEDGVTLVEIEKKECKEEMFGTDCRHLVTFPTEETRKDVEISDCYLDE